MCYVIYKYAPPLENHMTQPATQNKDIFLALFTIGLGQNLQIENGISAETREIFDGIIKLYHDVMNLDVANQPGTFKTKMDELKNQGIKSDIVMNANLAFAQAASLYGKDEDAFQDELEKMFPNVKHQDFSLSPKL